MSLAPRPSPLTSRRIARRAFTMIEMIVVMAIIVILLGIVVVGFKHVAAGNQKRQTQTLLERLKNITTNTFANKATSQRFFQQQVPAIYSRTPAELTTTPLPAISAPDTWDGVPAAADDALFKTGLILKAIQADPEAKRIFDDIPSERKRDVYFINSTGVCRDANRELLIAPPTVPFTKFTLPLDAWGNPILFVFDNWQDATSPTSFQRHNSTIITAPVTPTGGLTDIYSDATKTYWEFSVRPTSTDPQYTASPNPKYARPMPSTPYTKFGDALRSPDHLPFWASAGPDGNYATHDDNVYSFEN